MSFESRNPATGESVMTGTTSTAKIGAVFYVLWGVLHFFAARDVYRIAEGIPPNVVRGRLMQESFYLLFFAIAGIVIAIAMNWRNDRQGYWMNGVLIAIADIPFILFVLMPRYAPWWPGLIGPLLWALAFIFTTHARFKVPGHVPNPTSLGGPGTYQR
jgi:hypothetical protein